RGTEGQDGGRAALFLDDPNGLLDPALLVRADRVAEELRIDRLAVRGQHDPAARLRHALDADQDVHDRMRVLSGSNSGVEPATATVTGYCSPRYSTSSGVPTFATSGGRYDISRCLPTDGPEPAEVTYDRRPFASTSGLPSVERIGSRPHPEPLQPPSPGATCTAH